MTRIYDDLRDPPPLTPERIELYRRLSGEQKLQMCFELTHIAQVTLEAEIRYRHLGYTEEEVRLARIRHWLGDDNLFGKAYPGQPLLRI